MREVPEDITVTDAQRALGELDEATEHGRVIHLSKHGRRIAKIMPEQSQTEANEVFVAGARKIIERNREMFDQLAEL